MGCCAVSCLFQLLDRHLSAAEAGGSQALSSLDSQLAETEDVLAYVSDLLSLGVWCCASSEHAARQGSLSCCAFPAIAGRCSTCAPGQVA